MHSPFRPVLLAGIFCAAAIALSAPATRPTPEDKLPQVRKWFASLTSDDPAAREQARGNLLALKRQDLLILRKVVADLRPFDASLAQDLHEIVIHVYLSQSRYPATNQGFLGIRMPDPVDDPTDMDVLIKERMPGFCGFGALRDGDAVLDIEESPMEQPLSRDAFIAAVKTLPPGKLIHLKVLRQGQKVRIPVVLDARPAGDKDAIDTLTITRQNEAEEYWKKTFVLLLEEKPAAPGGGGKPSESR